MERGYYEGPDRRGALARQRWRRDEWRTWVGVPDVRAVEEIRRRSSLVTSAAGRKSCGPKLDWAGEEADGRRSGAYVLLKTSVRG